MSDDIDKTLKEALGKFTQGLSQFPFQQPSMFENVDGEILLGMDVQNGMNAGLELKEIKEHMLITGRTGAGKTSVIYHLLIQLIKKGIPFWAFDYKNDYRHLLNFGGFSNVKDFYIFNQSTFRFNPLRPPEGVKPQLWMQIFISVFGFSYYILSGGSNLLVEEITRLYDDYGVFKGSDKYPSVHDLYDSLDQHRKKAKGKYSMSEQEFMGRCLNRLGGLKISLKDFLDCDKGFLPEKLLDSNVVLELQGLINDHETFVTNIILAYIYQYRFLQGETNELKHTVVFDEAKKVFSRKKEFTEEFSSGPIVLFASQVRAFGEGLIVADQIPSELGKCIRNNVYTMISLSQSGGDSVTTVSSDLMLNPEQAAYTQQLITSYEEKIIEGIVKFPKYAYPFIIRIPFPESNKTVTESHVNTHMQQRWQSLAMDLKLRTPVEYIRAEKKAEEDRKKEAEKLKQAAERRAAKQPEKPKEAPKPEEPRAEEKPVSGNELIRFLTHVKDKPFMDVTERYKELGYTSTAVANKIQNELIGKGFMEKVVVNRGYKKGNITLFQITPKGMEFARIDKIDIPGKGGLEHKYWQHTIKEYYEKRGWYAVIEQCFGGKNVDVGIYNKQTGEQSAIEIELTNQNLIENLEKDTAAGMHKIIICTRSEEKKKAYEEMLHKAFDDETLKKVSFEVLGNFIPVQKQNQS